MRRLSNMIGAAGVGYQTGPNGRPLGSAPPSILTANQAAAVPRMAAPPSSERVKVAQSGLEGFA